MNTRKKATRMALAGFMAVLLTVAQASHGDTVAADALQGVEKEGNVVYSTPAPGSGKAKFFSSSMPDFGAVTMVPDPTTGFLGDYSRATSLAFTVVSTGTQPAGGSRVVLRSGGREWCWYGVNWPTEAGVPAETRISFRRADGWITFSGPADPDAAWAADIANVDFIGVRVIKSTAYVNGEYPSQEFTVSALTLSGGRGFNQAELLRQALLDRFGVDRVELVDPAAVGDSDGDGADDLEEILADYGNLVKIEEVATGAEGVRVVWLCAEGWNYTLLRADKAGGPYDTVVCSGTADHTGLAECVDTGVDAGEGVSYFYRVVRQ